MSTDAGARDGLEQRIDQLASDIGRLIEAVSQARDGLEQAAALNHHALEVVSERAGQEREASALASAVEDAERATAQGEWPEAIACWCAILQRFGDRAPARAYERLSALYRRRGELDEAETIVAEGCARFPDVLALRNEYAYVAVARHDWHEAVARWRLILKRAGGAPARVYAQLSAASRRLRRFEDAETVIEQGRASHPDITSLDVEHLRIAAARRDWPEVVARAHATLDRLAGEEPAHVYVELCQAHRSLAHFEAAAAAVAHGQAKYPHSVALAREQVEIAVGRQDWHEVVAAATAMIEMFGGHVPPRVYGHLHVAYRSLGDHRAADAAFEEYLTHKEKLTYGEWITRNDTLSDRDRALIRSHIASFGDTPTISILMATSDPEPDHLREAIGSVLRQLYDHWELCIVDDASSSRAVTDVLQEHARRDRRIRAHIQSRRQGFAACRTAALGMASGEWVLLLGAEDVLSEHALYLVSEACNGRPTLAVVYADEDRIDEAGSRRDPLFKPEWDYDHFLAQNLLTGMVAYRGDVARRVGSFRDGLDGADGWDFALRVLERVPAAEVQHVPFILYHARRNGDSSRDRPARLPDAFLHALNDHLARTRRSATAVRTERADRPRIRWHLPSPRPPVSVIIPTRDQCATLQACTDGLLMRTSYRPLELVVVDNGSRDAETLAFLGELRSRDGVTVIDAAGPFNFSRLVNLGVAASSGEVCLLLNNDIDVIHADWLDEMVGHALRADVGAVGAKLYYGNETIQHAGVVLGMGASGTAGHAHRFFPRGARGYGGRLEVAHSVSCVTGACLATRRDVYEAVGGFNESELEVALNDVDFCLRVRAAGHRIIWTPYAELYHFESVSRRGDTTPEAVRRLNAERAYLRRSWGNALDNDRFYSPNLDLGTESFDLAASPRVRKPWMSRGLLADSRSL